MGTRALELIRRWEGLRLNAYLCPAGIWTIGYGHTKWVHKGMSITKDTAELYLQIDHDEAQTAALRQCPGLVGNKLDAITDFVFNLGEGRLKASTLRRKINEGQDEEVPAEFRKWVFGGGRRLPGLVMRRDDEVRLWNERS